jgi:hypothetical protein
LLKNRHKNAREPAQTKGRGRLLRAQYLYQCPGKSHDHDENKKVHAAKVRRMGVVKKDGVEGGINPIV